MPDSGCKHGCRNFGSKKKTQRERVRERERAHHPPSIGEKKGSIQQLAAKTKSFTGLEAVSIRCVCRPTGSKPSSSQAQKR